MNNLVVHGCIVSNNAVDLSVDQSRKYRIALFTAVCMEQPNYLNTVTGPVQFEIFAETADLSIAAAGGAKDFTDKTCHVIFLSKPAVELLIESDEEDSCANPAEVENDYVSLIVGTTEYCLAQLHMFAMMMHQRGNSEMLKRLLYMMRAVTKLEPEEMLFTSTHPESGDEVYRTALVDDMFKAALENMSDK